MMDVCFVDHGVTGLRLTIAAIWSLAHFVIFLPLMMRFCWRSVNDALVGIVLSGGLLYTIGAVALGVGFGAGVNAWDIFGCLPW